MKKRLLFIPLHWEATPRPHEDYFNALNGVFDCKYYESDTDAQIFAPQYIFIQSGTITKESARFIRQLSGSKLIQWTGDARADVMENVTQYKGISDLTLLAVGIGQKEMYETALGSPVDYLQQGVFNSFFIEPKELQSGMITFIGNNYNHFKGARERTELCRLLSQEFDKFTTIGNGFGSEHNNVRSVPYSESPRLYNEAYISISHACFNDIEGYYSNRTFDIMASGGCCLMRYAKGAEKYFTHEENVMFYHTNEEAVEIVKFLIANPDVRNEIAMSGYNLAKKYHTFDYRAKELKQLIEKHL